MNAPTLSQAVDTFAHLTHAFTEDDLNNEGWRWRTYDQVRYAHLQTTLELRQLAADLTTRRIAQGQPPTLVQAILAQHQAAYRDFLALFIGLTEADLDRLPAPDEWPLRTILAHVNVAEQHFFQVIQHALEQHRRGEQNLTPMPDDTLAHLRSEAITTIFEGPLPDHLAYYAEIHNNILAELTPLPEADLDVPTLWWEEEPFPVRFRLHRFTAHLYEHAIQVEKTLRAIERTPGESKRLLRQLYNAQAGVEGAIIGLTDGFEAEQQALAAVILARAESVAAFV